MVAGLWLALCGSGVAVAEMPPNAPLVADPAIRQGVLPNGLRYGQMSKPRRAAACP